jgi:23S rRNA C2498 (ribose-2'-O)-methylase RlmM
MKLPEEIRLRAAGMPRVLSTVEQAINLIDRNLPPELARLPRWTFARALLVEALKTNKSRDLTTAIRQLQQALRNEKWM